MKKKEAYEMGYESGWNCASWVDVPELGSKVPLDIDWAGYNTVTAENFLDVMETCAFEAESNSRQFSPFEFTASEFNQARNSESLWTAYDEGIAAGIRANLKSRKLEDYYKEEE